MFILLFYILLIKYVYKIREIALRQFSRDISKYVAIAILCYIILFYCIILLFQFLN